MKQIFQALLLILVGCGNSTVPEEKKTGRNSSFFGDLFTSSFQSTSLHPIDYLGYLADTRNGLSKTKRIGSFVYTCDLQTPELLALKEIGHEKWRDSTLFFEKKSEYGDESYFLFKIQFESDDSGFNEIFAATTDPYAGSVEKFAFGMTKDFFLVQGQDTLKCSSYHFERTYGLGPSLCFMLVFPGIDKYRDVYFSYRDNFFESGIVTLKFDSEHITDLPTVKI